MKNPGYSDTGNSMVKALRITTLRIASTLTLMVTDSAQVQGRSDRDK